MAERLSKTSQATDTLLLIDGMNLMFQMFYGMPSRIVNRSGKAIQGTLGFVAATLKVIRMVQPSHVLVVFDGEHHNPRTDLDQAYKANRPDFSDIPYEETPFSQLEDVYHALETMGIQYYETQTVEADDLIASYTSEYSKTARIVVCSHDSDFFQLIADNVSILRYRGDSSTFWDSTVLKEKYGIEGSQYVDFKSLTGDTADNIKGISGVGPRTASRLLLQFNSLENLQANICEVSSERLRKALAESSERLLLNRRLIKMDCNVKLPIGFSQLCCPNTMEMSSKTVLTQLALMP